MPVVLNVNLFGFVRSSTHHNFLPHKIKQERHKSSDGKVGIHATQKYAGICMTCQHSSVNVGNQQPTWQSEFSNSLHTVASTNHTGLILSEPIKMFRSPRRPIKRKKRKSRRPIRKRQRIREAPVLNLTKDDGSFYTPDLPKRCNTRHRKSRSKHRKYQYHEPEPESSDDDDELPAMVSADESSDEDSESDDDGQHLCDTEACPDECDDDDDGTEFLSELRSFQWKHRLAEKAMSDLYGMLKEGKVGEHIRTGGKMPEKHTCADKVLQNESGVEAKTYHGCPVCNKHIWEEGDKDNVCPRPGCIGKRLNAKGHPFQEVIHYPLKSRLTALLRCNSYKHYIDYENWRRQSPDGVVAGTLQSLVFDHNSHSHNSDHLIQLI